MSGSDSTLLIQRHGDLAHAYAPQFSVRVTAGTDAGRSASSSAGRLVIGSGEASDLALTDPTVSRFHAELEATDEGIRLRDLGSTNGTRVGAVFVREVVVRQPTDFTVGRSAVRLELAGQHTRTEVSAATSFGALIGATPAMRAIYRALERAAPTHAPVLITGESGTGKELAARALHDASPRANGPFEIVDCGGLPPTLTESELFGHVRGAFTGAHADQPGAFERADGGTLFLDELGELPLELQPKLLRAIGEGQVRRVGGQKPLSVDVRIVAATHRDLRAEVNAGRFRADLFYRLAVIPVRMPALRERLDDLPVLVRHLVARIASERGLGFAFEPEASLLEQLASQRFPGNVRELRNYLEHLIILEVPPDAHPSPDTPTASSPSGVAWDELCALPYRDAKGKLADQFERLYVERLLSHTGGNVAEAARRSGVDRGTLFRMMRRHRMREEP